MPDMKKLLRDLADAYEQEEKGESDAELRREIAELKEAIAARPKAEQVEGMEEITDEEYEIIRQHRAAAAAPPPPAADPPAADPPPERKTRPGRKQGMVYHYDVDDQGQVVPVDIPRVWSNADEDDEVEIPEKDAA